MINGVDSIINNEPEEKVESNQRKISPEFQELILSSLLRDSYLMSLAVDEKINESYFDDKIYQYIYRGLYNYFRAQKCLPSKVELNLEVSRVLEKLQISETKIVYDTISALYLRSQDERYNESYARNMFEEFIKRKRSAKFIQELMQISKTPGEDYKPLVDDFIKHAIVAIGDAKVYSMTDRSNIEEMRDQAVGIDKTKVIKSFLPSINSYLQFSGWQPSTINMIVAAPGSGKSMYLMNEGKYAADQGFEVLHILIGDLTEYDGFIRYLSLVSGESQNSIIMKSLDDQVNLAKIVNEQYNKVLDRISIIAYPSYSITVDDLQENIKRIEKTQGKDYDMIIIDYPDNLLKSGNSSMYEEGGTLYGSLEHMAREFRSVLLVASQPKQYYWSQEILPLESAGESSRKQHAIDVMLTMGKVSKDANVGSIFMPKVRRGVAGHIIRFKTDFSVCKLEEIPEEEYTSLAAPFRINNKYK